MNLIITIFFCLSILSFNTNAQTLSWQHKVELVGAPNELTREVLKELFAANGFVYADYSSAGAMQIENTLTKEGGKWFGIGNKHRWDIYIELGRGNISIDMENNKLIFKNPVPADRLKIALAKTAKRLHKTKAVKEANVPIKYTSAEQGVVDKLRYFERLVLLKNITGDFDKNKLMTLFTNNGIPKTSFAGYPNLWLTLRSVQQIDANWYVVVHEDPIGALDKYDNSISIKNGKMIFTNMP